MDRHRATAFPGLALAVIALAMVLAYGIVGYVLIEHYAVLDAAFMTVTTVTTVGLAVRPLDGPGEVFTITLVVLGVSAFLYTFGVIVEAFGSGRWSRYWRRRAMDRRLDQLHDHVIICGYGRTGTRIASEVRAKGVPYVVIEMNPEPLESVRAAGEPLLVGDAASDEVLQHAGIARARSLVSAVDSDERNVYIVLTARSLNPQLFIVARSSFPDSVAKLERAGANRVVSPYTTSGIRMAALALQPAVVDVLDIVSGGGPTTTVEELLVPHGVSATAGDLRRSGAALLAIRAKDGTIHVNPKDSHRLEGDDVVVGMGTQEQVDALASALRP
ncbi:MAG: NAD-binding protein [Candidatus Dormibacteraeota bacterium]|nr:NAD-binding protein [Candidatus Dormibacteraeota bacterium]MBV8445868.1 NAD-binding protein [Candidatus Dormibacteraeota bacterium]